MSDETLQIVIAWTAEDIEIVRARRADLGERPETRAVTVPRAAMWTNSGTAEDVIKARAYAAREGYLVFTYPPTVKDPLGAAKRDVLSAERIHAT